MARPALRTAKIGCATAEPEQSPQPSAALGRIGGEAQPQKAVPTTAEKQGPRAPQSRKKASKLEERYGQAEEKARR